MKAFLLSSANKTGVLEHSSRAHLHISRPRLWAEYADIQLQARAKEKAKMEGSKDYKEWSHERLVRKVIQLEGHLIKKNSSYKAEVTMTQKKARSERQFNPLLYSTQLIALKLAYLGKHYNGFEYHANNPTPLPTIEEELWKALNKSRLIIPKETKPLDPGEVRWEGCEYSKCGRTDKGVSAFGQVIGIRVRSNRPLANRKADEEGKQNIGGCPTNTKSNHLLEDGLNYHSSTLVSFEDVSGQEDLVKANEISDNSKPPFDPIMDEIPYPTILNRLLPPDIRILAWCPVSPDFSARFSCRERQYKYFFTQPAFPPVPLHLENKTEACNLSYQAVQNGWLDIAAMQEAARQFVGLHDFRNFCKIDGSKQISNFKRRIFRADIVEEDDITPLKFLSGISFLQDDRITNDDSSRTPQNPKVYSFTLHGSAFLWHQVRHMVAVLFLVGQGLESPSIISELLDVQKNPRRPTYEMADDTPLVLWNCIFRHEKDQSQIDTLPWCYVGNEPGRGDSKYGSQALMENLWRIWRERKIDEVLAGALIDVVARQGKEVSNLTSTPKRGATSQRVFDGGNAPRLQGTYVPVMKKPLLDTTEEINEKYAKRKGFESADDLKEQGLRKPKKPVDTVEDKNE